MSVAANNRYTMAGLLVLSALTLGYVAQGLAFTAFTPALSAIAMSFNAHGRGILIAQQAVTIAALGLIIGGFASGWIVERLGGRRTAMAALVGFGIFGAFGMFAQTAWLLLASRVVAGFAVSCLLTACVAVIAALYEDHERAHVLGIAAAMGSVASVIGYIAGAKLTAWAGWRAAFVQYPIFAVLGLALVFAGMRDTAVAPPSVGAAPASGARLLPLYLLTLIIAAVMFMGSTQLTFLLPEDGVTSATDISMVLSTLTAVATVVSFGFGMIERRVGLQGALAVGFSCEAIGMILIGTVASPVAAYIGAGFMGGYVGNVIPYIYQAVTIKTGPETRARAVGYLTIFNYAGALINPFVFTPVSARFGLHHLFLIVGVFMALAAAVAAARRFGGSSKPGLHPA